MGYSTNSTIDKAKGQVQKFTARSLRIFSQIPEKTIINEKYFSKLYEHNNKWISFKNQILQ